MKKRIVAALLLWFLITILFYFAGSFYNASMNISNWTEESRSLIAPFWVILSIAALGIGLAFEDW